MARQIIYTQGNRRIYKNLKPNKSPRLGGFSPEFYKLFKKELIEPLTILCNHVLTTSVTPPTWQEASITVIPKEGKDKTNVESY